MGMTGGVLRPPWLPVLVTETVLVVEDQEVDAQVLEGTLMRLGPGIRVVRAVGLDAARAAFEDWSPSLVLLDLELPDGDGTAFLHYMRQRPDGQVPVVVVTADRDPRRRTETMAAGAADHIVKPLGLEDLEQTVLRAVSRWFPKEPAAAT